MMASIFNEKMTYNEAQKVFFETAIGKSREEREKIKAEYSAILPKIFKNDSSVRNGWLTEVKI